MEIVKPKKGYRLIRTVISSSSIFPRLIDAEKDNFHGEWNYMKRPMPLH
jgi:hypothetical protein